MSVLVRETLVNLYIESFNTEDTEDDYFQQEQVLHARHGWQL